MKSFHRFLFILFSVGVVFGLYGQKPMTPPKVPDGVVAEMEIPYVHKGDECQKLDLYLPEVSTEKPMPVIVWFHGGGWRGGSKYGCYPLGKKFVQKGYAIASVGYRFSDQAKFPAQLEDAKAAVRWLRVHAEKYNLDPDRIVAGGSSAGGYLAVFLGVAGDEREYDVGENLEFSSKVNAVLDFYGPTDFTDTVALETNKKYLSAEWVIGQLIGGAALENREKALVASPVTYVSKNSAPVLILHGDADKVVPLSQSKRLHEAYQKAGAISECRFMDGAGHGGKHYHSQETLDAIDAFLEKYLKITDSPR